MEVIGRHQAVKERKNKSFTGTHDEPSQTPPISLKNRPNHWAALKTNVSEANVGLRSWSARAGVKKEHSGHASTLVGALFSGNRNNLVASNKCTGVWTDTSLASPTIPLVWRLYPEMLYLPFAKLIWCFLLREYCHVFTVVVHVVPTEHDHLLDSSEMLRKRGVCQMAERSMTEIEQTSRPSPPLEQLLTWVWLSWRHRPWDFKVGTFFVHCGPSLGNFHHFFFWRWTCEDTRLRPIRLRPSRLRSIGRNRIGRSRNLPKSKLAEVEIDWSRICAAQNNTQPHNSNKKT